MTARACGSSSPAALLNPVKPPRGHHLDPPTPGLVPGGEPGPEDLPGPARGHVQQTRRPRLVACGGQVDDHRGRTCRPAWCGVTPRGHLPHGSEARGGIVSSEDLHTVEAVRLAGDGLLGPGQDCVVGGVPGDPQGGCYPADRHALQGRGTQPPLHRRAGQPRPGLSQAARVLPPHPAAVGAGEAPHAHQQLCGPPPHRHVGQAPGHRPTSLPLGAAGLAEGVLKPDRHAALHNRALRREELAHRGQTQGLQPQEGRQVGAGEGSLRHVEVSRDGLCSSSRHRGTPTPVQAQRRTHHPHALQQAPATTPSNTKSPFSLEARSDTIGHHSRLSRQPSD